MAIKPILLTTLTLGTVSGGVVGGYFLFKSDKSVEKPKTTTLAEAIKGDDFEALDTVGTNSSAEWKKLIEKYNGTDLPSEVTKITLTGTIQKSPSDEHAANIAIFKSACKALLEKTENYESDKLTVKNWCNKKSQLIAQPAT